MYNQVARNVIFTPRSLVREWRKTGNMNETENRVRFEKICRKNRGNYREKKQISRSEYVAYIYLFRRVYIG